MVRDEFNKVEITNDKQLKGVEFGKTQKVEFTAKKENELPEGDLNEKFVGKKHNATVCLKLKEGGIDAFWKSMIEVFTNIAKEIGNK